MDRIKTFIAVSAVFAAVVFLHGCKDPGPADMMTLPVPENPVLTYQEDADYGACLLFTWSPVAGADHYYVSLNDAADSSMVAEVESVNETGVVFQSVEGGLAYFCRVRAVNGFEYSDFASSGTVSVPLPPEPEEPDTGTGGSDTGTEEPDTEADGSDIGTGNAMAVPGGDGTSAEYVAPESYYSL